MVFKVQIEESSLNFLRDSQHYWNLTLFKCLNNGNNLTSLAKIEYAQYLRVSEHALVLLNTR